MNRSSIYLFKNIFISLAVFLIKLYNISLFEKINVIKNKNIFSKNNKK